MEQLKYGINYWKSIKCPIEKRKRHQLMMQNLTKLISKYLNDKQLAVTNVDFFRSEIKITLKNHRNTNIFTLLILIYTGGRIVLVVPYLLNLSQKNSIELKTELIKFFNE